MKEKLRNLVAAGLTAGVLVGCEPNQFPQGYPEGVTTPWGIYYTEENPSEETIEHEEAHWERYEEEGLIFFWKYMISPNFRCAEEVRANEIAEIEPTNAHPACWGVESWEE